MSGQGDSLVLGLVGMLPLGTVEGWWGPLVYDLPPAYLLIQTTAFSELLKTVL